MKKLIVNYVTSEKRFALMDGKKTEKIFIEQPKLHSDVGNIFMGIVSKVLPGMNAVFIDIGEKKHGWLHREKIPAFMLSGQGDQKAEGKSVSSFVHEGQKMLVQVEKDAAGSKGPRLTGLIEIPGENMIYLPYGSYVAVSKKISEPSVRERWRKFGHSITQEEEGLILRTSCEKQKEETVMEELRKLRIQYRDLLKMASAVRKPGVVLERDFFFTELISEIGRMDEGEVWIDDERLKRKVDRLYADMSPAFSVHHYTGKENIFSAYRLEHEIEKAIKRIVWLQNGSYLIFDEAEALTVIDVNSGKFSGKSDLGATVAHVNLLAVEEIARQMRLRDLGGMILVDFIDMKEEKDRHKVLKKMEQEISKDEKRIKIVGFTPLGILQLTRKKTKLSLAETLTINCPVCEGTGRVPSAETLAFQLERELWEHRGTDREAAWIAATKEVIETFSGEQRAHKKRLEEVLQFKLFFSESPAPKPFYEIRQFGTEEELSLKAKKHG